MVIVPPGKGARASYLADWLELTALLDSNAPCGSGSLRTWARRYVPERTSKSRRDPSKDADVDPEILWKEGEDVVQAVANEIALRVSLASGVYPFFQTVDDRTNTWHLRPITVHGPQTAGRSAYILCLLISGLRKKLIKLVDVTLTVNTVIGARFQIAACLAVGGYLSGQVISFGSPRAEGDAFLPALKRAFQRFGAYKPLETPPRGYPTALQDGGVDVIGWIDFVDGRGARLIVFGQSASGSNWVDKPISADIKQLTSWFEQPVFEFFYPAILMPFPAHHDLVEYEEDAQATWLSYSEKRFGIVFDRFRIASLVERALSLPEATLRKIDGHDQVGDMGSWVGEAIADLARQLEQAA